MSTNKEQLSPKANYYKHKFDNNIKKYLPLHF